MSSFEWPPTGGGSGSITSINGDSTAAQLLSVGTAGTNFAIVDAGSGSHVFNLPSASASNRGALTSADWTTFNGKQASGNYITALTGDVVAAGPGSSAATIQSGVIVNSMVNSSAAIDLSKLSALTASLALVSSAGGVIAVSSVTATELGYVSGATSNIQAQINSIVAVGSGYTIYGSTGTPQSITAVGGITATAVQRQLHFLVGNGGAVVISANPQVSAGTIVGQELRLVGTDDTNTVTISFGTGLVLNGACVLRNGAVIDLFWNGASWTEAGRNSM